MEIGLFQLENLMISRSPFHFFDLRTQRAVDLPREVEQIVKAAAPMAEHEVAAYLEKMQIPKDAPVVLLSQTAHASAQLASKLEDLGFSNVYVVAGGVEGLLSEL